MNVLFICRANVGRSQSAMELYRKNGGQADSAGTQVDQPGTTLAERPGAANIVQVMRKDHSVDMIHNARTQLTESVAESYDKLVVMAEPETWPDWLKGDKRTIYWDIQDTKDQDVATTRKVVNEINEKVRTLLQQSS